jgi:hypothetical protein
MTSVNVTTQTSSVTVTDATSSTAVTTSSASTVTATTAGPRGPQGPAGPSGLVVDSAAKVNGSVVYYDGSAFKADATWTTSTLTDGGNF